MQIRLACIEDSDTLRAIYAQYIDTPVTFEYRLPPREEFARRVAAIIQTYPYLVWEEAGQIKGYAYAHRQMEREAYQWNAELSIYLDREYTSRGMGKKLYGILMDILRIQGICTVYGGVTLPNERSEGLHCALGFRLLGIYRQTGFKCGAWQDVGWFEKQIAPYPPDPAPIRSIEDISAQELQAAIQRHL